MPNYSERKVLVIYAGGTIGMKKREGAGPLEPGSLQDLRKNIPDLKGLPYQVDYEEFLFHGKLIDSANANREFYNALSQKIHDQQGNYDGVVVVFGTDTMGPSAGSISYQLEGLRKPTIFTGSMKPACEKDSDGPRNLIDAINVAARAGYDVPQIPEVAVCFNGKLYRGVAARKWNADGIDSIDSPGVEPLAEISGTEGITINEKVVLKEPAKEAQLIRHSISEEDSIGQLMIYSCDDDLFERIVKGQMETSNAILIYGVPIREGNKKLEIIRRHQKEGVHIFYMNDNPPSDSSWIEARGITDFQQAMAKISYVLSRTNDPVKVRELFQANLRGEGEGPRVFESEILHENREIGESRTEMAGVRK